jgi:hypothetical protein
VKRLVDETHLARPEDLPGIAMRLAGDLAAVEAVIYLVDYQQSELVPLVGPGAPAREPLAIDGTVPGRVFATGVPLSTGGNVRHRLWLPIVDGTERLGVFEVVTESAPEPSVEEYRVIASLFAEALVSRRQYGDAAERARRRLPMQLAAEIIWSQLPPLTFATPHVAVSVVLEPCYEIGGDAFDYAINSDILHVALFDTLGHGITASALPSLAISAYRNARRCGLDLADTYRSADKWVDAQYPDRFATAVLAELDTRTGVYRKISAGHPGELLLRDGKVIKQLPSPTAMPIGLGQLGGAIPDIVEESLQPGDTLLLYTDGVVEARDAAGEQFGVDRLADFVTRALADQLPAPETMRRLVRAILAHQDDRLQDDATAALVEWRPTIGYGGQPVP